MAGYVLSPKAARALTRLVRGGANATATKYSAGSVFIDGYKPPFTVQWSSTQASGQGAWEIWLPDKSQLVMHDGEYITPSGITAATGEPEGWYTIDDLQSDAEEVWLVAHIPDPDSTGSPSAELSGSEGQATTGESVINLLIAQMETDENTNAKWVKQFVDSAVVFGGGTGGESVVPDDVSTEFIPDPPQGQQPTGDEGKLQIKGFKAGTPNPQTTVADDLKATGTLGGHVLFRESDGSLSYKSIGSLNLPTSTVNLTNQTVLTGLNWNTSTHELEISSAKMNVTNGLITSWTTQQMLSITTTSITTIIGS